MRGAGSVSPLASACFSLLLLSFDRRPSRSAHPAAHGAGDGSGSDSRPGREGPHHRGAREFREAEAASARRRDPAGSRRLHHRGLGAGPGPELGHRTEGQGQWRDPARRTEGPQAQDRGGLRPRGRSAGRDRQRDHPKRHHPASAQWRDGAGHRGRRAGHHQDPGRDGRCRGRRARSAGRKLSRGRRASLLGEPHPVLRVRDIRERRAQGPAPGLLGRLLSNRRWLRERRLVRRRLLGVAASRAAAAPSGAAAPREGGEHAQAFRRSNEKASKRPSPKRRRARARNSSLSSPAVPTAITWSASPAASWPLWPRR